jgi:SOS regulatory protein LexA
MTVELGRRMLRTVYSNVHTYQLVNGSYIPKIIINPTSIKALQGIDVGNCRYFNSFGEILKLPVLGQIPCGEKRDGADNEGKVFPICDSVLDTGEYFVVVAEGDSMVDAGIDDGDYIIVKSQPVAEVGQIVVAFIDGETTLKRFYRDEKNKKIILHPENENYEDIVYDYLEIQGIAVHVIKKLK